MQCVDNACVDNASPDVIDLHPEDGADGVRSTESIVLTFTEPMNRASVEGALSITSLPVASRNLVWNDSATTLTVVPTNGLVYATGTSEEITARSYTISVSTSAKDLAGNELRSAATASFTTLRRITAAIPGGVIAQFSKYQESNGQSPSACPTNDGTVQVGHVQNPGVSTDFHIYATFDLSLVGDRASLESAKFSAVQMTPNGTFYPLGITQLRQLESGVIDRFVMSQDPLQDYGTFTSNAESTNPTKSVSTSLASEWMAGNRTIQLFELAHSGNPANNTFATFDCEGFSLSVQYLIP